MCWGGGGKRDIQIHAPAQKLHSSGFFLFLLEGLFLKKEKKGTSVQQSHSLLTYMEEKKYGSAAGGRRRSGTTHAVPGLGWAGLATPLGGLLPWRFFSQQIELRGTGRGTPPPAQILLRHRVWEAVCMCGCVWGGGILHKPGQTLKRLGELPHHTQGAAVLDSVVPKDARVRGKGSRGCCPRCSVRQANLFQAPLETQHTQHFDACPMWPEHPWGSHCNYYFFKKMRLSFCCRGWMVQAPERLAAVVLSQC